MARIKKSYNINYKYPQDSGASGFPKDADEICEALGSGLAMHRTTSILLIISMLGCLGYFITPAIGVLFGIVTGVMIILKILIIQMMAVHLNYSMDQNWKNFANTRMAPFTYMVRCQRVWEVLNSQGVYDRKYHAGCGVQISRKDVQVEFSLPFPFRTNVKGYALFLKDKKFVFLPDCVYMIQGTKFTALRYEHIKWQIGTTKFVESIAPADAKIVGYTWQYVNKKGGPDKRFNYNPQLSECLYGEFEVNFANHRRAKFLLSGTKMVEGMMRL